jgi:O-antigen/teichoic acid export membrane protein
MPQHSARARVVTDISWMAAAQYVSEGLYFARGALLAAFLGPAGFGIWSSMKIVDRFLPYAPIGSLHGMLQLSPHADARGDASAAERYRATAVWIGLAAGFGVAALVAAIALAQAPAAVQRPWLLFAAMLALEEIGEIQLLILRSQRRFVAVGAATVGSALGSTVLGGIAAWRFGLSGFLLAVCLSHAAVAFIVARASRTPPRPRFDPATARQLISTGSGILVAQVLGTLMQNLDKLLLWMMLGSGALGLYAVPCYLADLVLLLPQALVTVLYPQLLVTVARTGSRASAWPYLERVTVLLAHVGCLVLGGLYLTWHLAIEAWLPEYVPAIAPGRVLILVAFLPIVAALPATVLISLNGQAKLIAVRAVAACVTGGAVFLTIGRGSDLAAVAWATAPGFLLFSVATLLAALRHAGLPWPRRARMLLSVFAPYAVLLALLAAFGPQRTGGSTPWTLPGQIAIVCGPLLVSSVFLASWFGVLPRRARR